MSGSYTATEVHYRVRSISLPFRLHPSSHKIEKEPKRLKTWEASQALADAASPLQAEAAKASLTGLAELYNCLDELVGCPLTRQAVLRQHHHHEGKHVEKAFEMSVGLLDVCGSARELLLLMKEQMLDLQSALRRKGLDSSIKSQICGFICFRKKARKDISRSLKALKAMESSFKSYPHLDVDHHLLMVINVLTELSSITISFFRKLILFMCAPTLKKNTRGWSLFSRIVSIGSNTEKRIITEVGGIDVALCSFHRFMTKTDAKVDLQKLKRRLEELGGSMRELEAGLDCLFRCLIQHRVTLLNLLTP